MSKLIFMMLLIIVSNSAMADHESAESQSLTGDWVELGRTEKLTVYASRPTTTKDSNFLKMWILLDYNKPYGSKLAMSDLAQNEYDCKREQYRNLSAISFAQQRGQGKVIDVIKGEGIWLPLPRGAMWKAACGK